MFAPFLFSEKSSVSEQPAIVMDIPGYPFVFELNKGDSILIDRTYNSKRIFRTVYLKEIRLFSEYNSWFPDSTGKANYYKAEVDIIVSVRLLL
ncbi:MAG: hypothetical protein A2X04_16810 [Bacteroidetes bacterium GWF2_41_9]|nr:MAG: hypothetical protein A2X03_01180 [Bacteroidetes bacterium GWA2_40_15]OFY58942.1 MAG: hypothetical protein A2X04_16810 [Bacteroidetes bacterium GWF2_41_9]